MHDLMLCFSEIIVKVKIYWRQEFFFIHFQFKKVFTFIFYSILFQSLCHVEVFPKVLPRVALSMNIVRKISLQNLIHGLFCTHLYNNIISPHRLLAGKNSLEYPMNNIIILTHRTFKPYMAITLSLVITHGILYNNYTLVAYLYYLCRH